MDRLASSTRWRCEPFNQGKSRTEGRYERPESNPSAHTASGVPKLHAEYLEWCMTHPAREVCEGKTVPLPFDLPPLLFAEAKGNFCFSDGNPPGSRTSWASDFFLHGLQHVLTSEDRITSGEAKVQGPNCGCVSNYRRRSYCCADIWSFSRGAVVT